jgi:hypothetical protein
MVIISLIMNEVVPNGRTFIGPASQAIQITTYFICHSSSNKMPSSPAIVQRVISPFMRPFTQEQHRLISSSCSVLACPWAPFVEGSDGETAWEQLQNRSSDWNLYCLFLKAHHIREKRAVSFRPVHAAASCNNRFGKILQICIEQDAENLRIQDEKGNLPLHIILGAESASTVYCKPEHVRMILEAYPEAAAIPNHNGQFPLHLALGSGYCCIGKCKWEQVIQPIVAAAPQVALVGCPLMLLFNEGTKYTELDMLYSLLRVNPTQLNGATPTQPSTTPTQSLQVKKRAHGSL